MNDIKRRYLKLSLKKYNGCSYFWLYGVRQREGMNILQAQWQNVGTFRFMLSEKLQVLGEHESESSDGIEKGQSSS